MIFEGSCQNVRKVIGWNSRCKDLYNIAGQKYFSGKNVVKSDRVCYLKQWNNLENYLKMLYE